MNERSTDDAASPRPPVSAAAKPVSEVLLRLAARRPRDSRYRALREIARGGMGSIVEVFDEDIRRSLAMKVILEGDGSAEAGDRAPSAASVRARFLEEAQITSQLDHPGIVPVHELGLDSEGRLFFVMKLVKGRNLRAVFDLVFARAKKNDNDNTDKTEKREDWDETRALGIVLRVCEAMAYAHAKGVIHRDLKPANVMVGSYGEVYVMDWGVARILGRQDRHDIRLRSENSDGAPSSIATGRRAERTATPDSPLFTMDGDVVGTPAYMPPEQARGEVEKLGPPSDVYSIGAMLYHLLAREMPYVPKGARLTNRTLLARVIDGPPAPLRSRRKDVPAELAAIVEKAMARDSAKRYPSTSSLAEDLRAYLEHRVVKAYSAGAVAELRKWVERNKALAATAAASLLLLITAIVMVNGARVRADESAVDAGREEARARDNARRAKEEESLAEAAAAEASREREHVLRLSDLHRLGDLMTDAASLWPAHPSNSPGMRSWLDRARTLVGRLPDHRARLAELREAVGSRAADGTWEFGAREDAWQHGLLDRLVAGVEGLARDDRAWNATTIAALERRLEFADALRRRTIEEPKARWDEAIADIRASSRYGGLVLAPQWGLVPIGKDPSSGLWEFWHVQSGDEPERDAHGRIRPTGETGLVLVLIPGGTFKMGSPESEVGREYVEGLPRDVKVEPYFISKYEMTQAQWKRFMGSNPSYYGFDGAGDWEVSPLHPVELVSWHDCDLAFSRLGLELPSEKQWERAARGGTETAWWTGNDRESLRGKANLADQAAARAGANWLAIQSWPDLDDGHAFHAPVGSYAANPFGLHEVAGNVWEWCREDFGRGSLRVIPVGVGDGESQAEEHGIRGIRGGGFDYTANSARSAARNSSAPELRASDIGVRPARSVASE